MAEAVNLENYPYDWRCWFANTYRVQRELSKGQVVYQVSRAEVYEYYVDGSYYVEGYEDENFYWLTRCNNAGLYDHTRDSELGKSVFTRIEDAKACAREYVETHDVWLASDIRSKESRCWETYSENCGYSYAWYILVPDSGFVVLKAPYQYIHAIDFHSEERARAYLETVFIPSIEYRKIYVPFDKDGHGGYQKERYMTETDISHIEYKNLYPCKHEGTNWNWSEDGYTFISDEFSIVTRAREEIEQLETA